MERRLSRPARRMLTMVSLLVPVACSSQSQPEPDPEPEPELTCREAHGKSALTLAPASPMATAARVPVSVVEYADGGAGDRQILRERRQWRRWPDAPQHVAETSYPRLLSEHAPPSQERIVELASPSRKAIESLLQRRQVRASDSTLGARAAGDEVTTLVDSGPPANRIDVVFMGDGYTLAERDKFTKDMDRIVAEMFEGATFRSYLPVFNVHTVFRPSAESGIGRGGPKDTAFGLYRPGDTLRGIIPTRPEAAREACAQAPECDYPVIIANDPYYGGLGGEFAIGTSSPESATIVLRHELGHNFGRVGEEYDGGYAYVGANYSATLDVGWAHWLTGGAPAQAEPAVVRAIDWPWYNLAPGPYRFSFTSDGSLASASMLISASGLQQVGAMTVTLNGDPLPLDNEPSSDRKFYDFDFAAGFAAGTHELVFSETVADGDNWLSSYFVAEYGQSYHFDPDYIGAYPVFDHDGNGGYRPNHDTCLMREMRSPKFCSVCQENMWLQFFASIRLIDQVGFTQQGGHVAIAVATPQLGQLRQGATSQDGFLAIRWLRDGVAVPELDGLTSFVREVEDARGAWQVDVWFQTAEVRRDQGLLGDSQTVMVTPSSAWREDFENGADSWTASGLWHLASDSQCLRSGSATPEHGFYYGLEDTCNYDTRAANSGELLSPVIRNVTAGATLSFSYFRNVESYPCDVDRTIVEVVTESGATEVFALDASTASVAEWQNSGAISLADFAGRDIHIRWRFDSGDAIANNHIGWFVDDIAIDWGE